jgi:hypothetical protein
MGAHRMQRVASALTFLEQHLKDGNEFLNHIVRVTGDETWFSFMNVETKDQSKQWLHTHSPDKLKKFKHSLSARKLILGQERTVDGGIYATRDNSVRSILQNTKKNCIGLAIQNKMLTSSVMLLHDNVCPHTATQT